MKMERRQLILYVALIGTVLAVFLSEPSVHEDGDLAAPTRVEKLTQQSDPASEKPMAFGKPLRNELPSSEADPFRPKSWYVAPPPPPPQPPPKPTAPPLPFSYMGMFEDRGKPTVFLMRGDESFAVAPGERFADAYRLDAIGRGTLAITYLPLSIQQSLAIGVTE